MNNSVSTITGKTKIKIVLLGNQSVGKSSAIDRYVNGKFDENEHVVDYQCSQQSVSTILLKLSHIRAKCIGYNCGILPDNNGLNL